MTDHRDHIMEDDLPAAMAQIRQLQAEAAAEGDTERLEALMRRADWIRYLAFEEDPDHDHSDGQERP